MLGMSAPLGQTRALRACVFGASASTCPCVRVAGLVQSRDTTMQHDALLLLCSLAVFFASFDYLDSGEGNYALSCRYGRDA
eukprot:4525563-Pleurochrysis_carterae.AAC.3